MPPMERVEILRAMHEQPEPLAEHPSPANARGHITERSIRAWRRERIAAEERDAELGDEDRDDAPAGDDHDDLLPARGDTTGERTPRGRVARSPGQRRAREMTQNIIDGAEGAIQAINDALAAIAASNYSPTYTVDWQADDLPLYRTVRWRAMRDLQRRADMLHAALEHIDTAGRSPEEGEEMQEAEDLEDRDDGHPLQRELEGGEQ
jgi:hypothetical protein